MSTTTQKTKSQIIREIEEYVANNGGAYSDWYAGIAAVPKKRLFDDHNVDQSKGAWIYRVCASSDQAREIEEHFFDLGMKGAPGGGDSDTDSVYAYKITSSTRE